MSLDVLELAERAARAAGELLCARFGAPARRVSSKTTATDLVSDADRDAEETIVAILREARPRDAILAEEGGGGAGAGVRWIVDPLDGTVNFLKGIPQWSISVAAVDRDGPLVGVVHDPVRDETFRARRGRGADLDGNELRLGPGPPLERAVVATGFNYDPDERVRQARRLVTILPRVADVRRFGSAALDLAWLSAGRGDGYYETGLNPWDWAAGALLVREAGGEVEELPALGASPPGLVAARPGLLAPLRELVVAAY